MGNFLKTALLATFSALLPNLRTKDSMLILHNERPDPVSSETSWTPELALFPIGAFLSRVFDRRERGGTIVDQF